MRTNNISAAFKIIIFAITAIIVCVVSVVAIKTTNEGKAMVNAGTTQVKEMTQSYTNINLASYDNTNIIGSALCDLIKTTIDEGTFLSIRVKTIANSTNGAYYNKHFTSTTSGTTTSYSIDSVTAQTAIPTTTSSNDYINPNAQFTGKVYKDINKNIIAIEFDQMK